MHSFIQLVSLLIHSYVHSIYLLTLHLPTIHKCLVLCYSLDRNCARRGRYDGNQCGGLEQSTIPAQSLNEQSLFKNIFPMSQSFSILNFPKMKPTFKVILYQLSGFFRLTTHFDAIWAALLNQPMKNEACPDLWQPCQNEVLAGKLRVKVSNAHGLNVILKARL